MRILMLSYEFPPIGGGGARVVHGLGRELVALGCEVDLVTMAFRQLPRRECVNGINVHRVPCARSSAEICHPREMLPYIAAAVPVARKLIKRNNYNLNHTHFIFPDGLIAYLLKRFTGLPYVITTHGSDVPSYNPDRFKLYHKLAAPLWHTITRKAEQIICPSENLQALVHAQCKDLPTTLIPNGVRTTRFDPDRPKRNRILVVTRMFQRKGVQYLLEALRDLSLDYDVAIVGDGPYLSTLREQAQGLKTKVTFHGWLENGSAQLKDLYETSRIFVLTSEAENFPIVLLEAMAAGMAIITSRGTGCAEVVGGAGVLVELRDIVGIRSALLELACAPQRCARLGHLARERLERRFSWRRVAQQYLDLYSQQVGETKSVATKAL